MTVTCDSYLVVWTGPDVVVVCVYSLWSAAPNFNVNLGKKNSQSGAGNQTFAIIPRKPRSQTSAKLRSLKTVFVSLAYRNLRNVWPGLATDNLWNPYSEYPIPVFFVWMNTLLFCGTFLWRCLISCLNKCLSSSEASQSSESPISPIGEVQ